MDESEFFGADPAALYDAWREHARFRSSRLIWKPAKSLSNYKLQPSRCPDSALNTYQMDVLRCKTPEMVHKELTVHTIAYNLIRSLMLDVAITKGVAFWQVSFKGTVDRVRQWSWLIATTSGRKRRERLVDSLRDSIAEDEVPERPYRIEPRVRKRRPKPYQLMTKPPFGNEGGPAPEQASAQSPQRT